MRRVLFAIALAGCRIGFDPTAPSADSGLSITIRGTVTGTTGPGLVLQDNGGDDLAIAGDGAFAFATPLHAGDHYDITVKATPANQQCTIANGTGVAADGISVTVTCFAANACPPQPVTFSSDGTFTVPSGCSMFTVVALGGGGAGGGRNMGNVGSDGGRGGRAVKTFSGIAAGTQFAIAIGQGGTCGTRTTTAGGYTGGGGGTAGGNGNGSDGAGSTALGGAGGAGAGTIQPGGSGGHGFFGGGGGGGGGDVITGNSAGGATTFRLGTTDYVVAGGGGAAGASDQNGDVGGVGGAACNGTAGVGGASGTGVRAGGGGGGGACSCMGSCDAAPTPAGGAGGTGAASGGCTAAQNGAPGGVIIMFP